MTATTTAAAPARARRPQWVRAMSFQGGVYAFLMAWFWGIALPVVALVLAIVGRYTEVSSSGMAYTHHATLWFPFSLGVIVTAMYLPVHVANGMTRRSFARAALVAGAGLGVGNALVATGALLLEERIYAGLGWVHGVAEGSETVFADGVLLYLLNLALLFSAGQLSGLLIGLTYYRAGGWIGTLALPLGLAPIGAVGIFGLGDTVQWQPFGFAATWDLGPALVVAVLVLAALAILRIARNIPIETNKE